MEVLSKDRCIFNHQHYNIPDRLICWGDIGSLVIKNACFISYSRGQGVLIEGFTEQLKKALENELGGYLDEPVYLDKDRLQPGFNYNVALSSAICESICMIVIYTPKYDDSDYCKREFSAMELIEKERVERLGDLYDKKFRMIIPVILRGVDYLPENIKNIEYRNDFSKFALYSADITLNPDFEPVIREIVKVIFQIYRMLKLNDDVFLHHDCKDYVLPSTTDIQSSWIGAKQPNNFPGRNNPSVEQ